MLSSTSLSYPPSTPKRPHHPVRGTPHPNHIGTLLPPSQSQHPRAIINLPNLGMVEAV
jgi:hypothetical protein